MKVGQRGQALLSLKTPRSRPLRQQILLIPAQLVRTGNRSRLNLPASGHCEVVASCLAQQERLRP